MEHTVLPDQNFYKSKNALKSPLLKKIPISNKNNRKLYHINFYF